MKLVCERHSFFENETLRWCQTFPIFKLVETVGMMDALGTEGSRPLYGFRFGILLTSRPFTLHWGWGGGRMLRCGRRGAARVENEEPVGT